MRYLEKLVMYYMYFIPIFLMTELHDFDRTVL